MDDLDREVELLKNAIGRVIEGEDWTAVCYALAELLVEGAETDEEMQFIAEVLNEVGGREEEVTMQ